MSNAKSKNVEAKGDDAKQDQSIDSAVEGMEVPAENAAANDARPADDAAMAQVRDLLFGAAISDLRKEFQQNSRSVLGTVKSLHREFKQRTDELQQQLDSLQLASDKEVVVRERQCTELNSQLEQSTGDLGRKLEEQQREMERTASRLGADVKTQQRNQQRALDKLENKMFSALKEYSDELRTGKLNRNEFAELLSSLAGKVSGPTPQATAANEAEAQSASA